MSVIERLSWEWRARPAARAREFCENPLPTPLAREREQAGAFIDAAGRERPLSRETGEGQGGGRDEKGGGRDEATDPPHAPPGRGARLLADLIRYGFASALALALDVSVLTLCLRLPGLSVPAAAAAGFLSGLALIYLCSVRVVFRDRRSVTARAEMIGFLLTGLAGLALTGALMHVLADRMGFPLSLSKIATSGLVFLFNFTARRSLLFSRGG